MKLNLLCIIVSALIVGCASLNVAWNASYNMPQIARQVSPIVPVK